MFRYLSFPFPFGFAAYFQSFQFRFIAAITYYNIYYISPIITILLIQNRVSGSLQKSKKKFLTLWIPHQKFINCDLQLSVPVQLEQNHESPREGLVQSHEMVYTSWVNSLLAHTHNPLRCWGVTSRRNVWYHDKNQFGELAKPATNA